MDFIRYGSLTPQHHEIEVDEDMISFHAPPIEYGFYAFPKYYIEPFLLGGSGAGSIYNGRFSILKNPETNKPYYISINEYFDFKNKFRNKINFKKREFALEKLPTDDWGEFYDNFSLPTDNLDEYLGWISDYSEKDRNLKRRVIVENKPNRFKYDGLIWHHLFYNPEFNKRKDKLRPYYIKQVRTWVLTDIQTYERCLKRAIGDLKYAAKYYSGGKWIKPSKENGCCVGNYGGYPINHFDRDMFEVYIETLQKPKNKHK